MGKIKSSALTWPGSHTSLQNSSALFFSPNLSFFAVSPVQAAQLFRTGASEPQPRRSRMILAADAHISWSSYHPSVCWVRLVLELGAVRATAPGERHGTLCTDRLDERWYFVGSSWFCAIHAKPRKFQLPRVWWCSQYYRGKKKKTPHFVIVAETTCSTGLWACFISF